MKKSIWIISAVLIIAVVCLIFHNRNLIDLIPGNHNLNKGKYPSDQIGTTWVCENPDIHFDVIEVPGESPKLTGSINHNGNTINIHVIFNPGRSIFIYDDSSDNGKILTGVCNFESDRFVVEIEKENDQIFDGKYDSLTFYKKPQ